MTTKIPTLKAIGRRGDWTVKIEGYDFAIPVSHQLYWKAPGCYHEPNTETTSPARMTEHANMLAEVGMVCLTLDNVEENGTHKRKGYVALFEVENVEYNEDGLTFNFVRRIAHLVRGQVD